jgi:hypothetical protein
MSARFDLRFADDFDYDRYRNLIAAADNEKKRLALIDLLVAEKARDKLAQQTANKFLQQTHRKLGSL